MIEIRKNGDKKVNMLAPGMTRESHELLKQYQNILTQAELIATGEMQRYASRMKSYVQENGLYPHGIVNAPIRKGKNIEYVLHIKNCNQYAKLPVLQCHCRYPP